jgi:hypothetical protein
MASSVPPDKPNDARAVGLFELDDEFAANGLGGTLQGVELNLGVGWVEQALDLGPAGVHLPRELAFGNALGEPALLDLPGQDPLDGGGRRLLVDSFLDQDILERGTDMGIRHDCTAFCPERASARSLSGVCCVFLTNPWSNIIRPSETQNR